MTVMAPPGFEAGHKEGQPEGADLAVKAMFLARTVCTGAADSLGSEDHGLEDATTARNTATTAQKTARKTGCVGRLIGLE